VAISSHDPAPVKAKALPRPEGVHRRRASAPELRDRVTVLEGDNDALIGETHVLQEQLEQAGGGGRWFCESFFSRSF